MKKRVACSLLITYTAAVLTFGMYLELTHASGPITNTDYLQSLLDQQKPLNTWFLLCFIARYALGVIIALSCLAILVELLFLRKRQPSVLVAAEIFIQSWRIFVGNKWSICAAATLFSIGIAGTLIDTVSQLTKESSLEVFLGCLILTPTSSFIANTCRILSANTAYLGTLLACPAASLAYSTQFTTTFAIVILASAPWLSKLLKSLAFDPEYTRDAVHLTNIVWPLAIVSAAFAAVTAVSVLHTGKAWSSG